MLTREPIRDTYMDAIGREFVAGFVGVTRRTGPQLVFIFCAHSPTMIDAVVEACARRNGKVTPVTDMEGIVDLPDADKCFDIRLEMMPLRQEIARTREIAAFGFSVIVAEMQEASICFNADVAVPVEVRESSDPCESLIALVREGGVNVGVLRTDPDRPDFAIG